MSEKNVNRRSFIGSAAAVTAGALVSANFPVFASSGQSVQKLAALGGAPIRAGKTWPAWPYVDDSIVDEVSKTVKSGDWCRIDLPVAKSKVAKLEKDFALMQGAKYAVATGSGTQALSTSVHALGIEAGDEVITSPYTDMGTLSGILTSRALPILADLDPDSYQLDANDVRKKISSQTRALMPVHMMGIACDMRNIMEIANKHKFIVIEDACQAHMATFDGKPLGTIGDAGCFSFQSTKVICCGEGGAVVTNDAIIADKCYTVQNHGTDRSGKNVVIGPKYRMNELEAAILISQMATHRQRHTTRNNNAKYLREKLKGFKGLVSQKLYPGTGDGSYYLYAMSYKKEHFNNAPRSQFLKALNAEGVPVGPYLPTGLHKHAWVDHILGLEVYKKMYPAARLKAFKEQTMHLPNCDRVCEEMVLLPGSGPLSGSIADMDDIINAIFKVYENRDKLKSI